MHGMPNTDFTSHHIEGYANAAPELGHFSVELISHVTGNLWQGGCIGGVELPDSFEYVVSLYPWEQYKLSAGTCRDEIEMYDAGAMPDLVQLKEIALKVRDYMDKGKTLVHCQAGLNRSGLVAAYALILDGMMPEAAVRLLRASRCEHVLCNKTFETWLLNEAGKQTNSPPLHSPHVLGDRA